MNWSLFLKNGSESDYFYENYIDRLGMDARDRGRWVTMKIALNLFLQSQGHTILETGCQREPEDWGAGASTSIFIEFLDWKKNGCLFSVDNCQEHLDRAKSYIDPDSKVEVDFVLSDSVEFLKNGYDYYNGAIDLLYLDSYDYPYGELLDCYGGQDNLQNAISTLRCLSEEEIVEKHGDIILPCQEHCLKEIEAAAEHLVKGSVVLIDDNSLPGGGKPRLARQWLRDNGFRLILDYHQTLWEKVND